MIFVYIEICDFFQHFRETKSMEINRWASNFMYLLRKFYKMQELAFVYDKAINKFGVASDNAKLIYRGYNKKYFGGVLGGDFDFGDFRKIINQHSHCLLLRFGRRLRYIELTVWFTLQSYWT